MRAMLIDDEKPALMHLERLLLADGRIEPAALCTSASEGLERLAQEPFEAVFLDIGMPEMNGLEAAEHIQQAYPGISILFVTAYSEYAVEAFDLQAIDYLLKPIGAPRLRRAIDRLVPSEGGKLEGASRQTAAGTGLTGLPTDSADLPASRPSSGNSAQAFLSGAQTGEASPNILMFRRLELADPRTGEAYPIKWRTAKVQELLAYLLHEGEQWVRRDELIESIWPDVPPEKAATHLHTSVYQLRKILKEWAPRMKLEYRQESYRLLREGAQSDVQRFETGISSLAADAPDRTACLERLLSLWRGGYLEHHDYGWAGVRADELKRLRVRLALTLADRERQEGRYQEAIRLLTTLQEEDPFAEDVCRLTMLTYADMGDERGMRESYRLLCLRLEAELGVQPERRTEELYERLQH